MGNTSKTLNLSVSHLLFSFDGYLGKQRYLWLNDTCSNLPLEHSLKSPLEYLNIYIYYLISLMEENINLGIICTTKPSSVKHINIVDISKALQIILLLEKFFLIKTFCQCKSVNYLSFQPFFSTFTSEHLTT